MLLFYYLVMLFSFTLFPSIDAQQKSHGMHNLENNRNHTIPQQPSLQNQQAPKKSIRSQRGKAPIIITCIVGTLVGAITLVVAGYAFLVVVFTCVTFF
jgi:hypothetical protein